MVITLNVTDFLSSDKPMMQVVMDNVDVPTSFCLDDVANAHFGSSDQFFTPMAMRVVALRWIIGNIYD